MNEQQNSWFSILVKDREDSAKTLEKPSMRGIKNSVVEKYSDQAHFIYELLQNANDAKATRSLFKLTADGLYFKHNGIIHFSVSNPNTEDSDKESNTLGHINSITAIANSNKTEASIGKFGVGFKAVFQYTETPHIYDPNFQFKIERFIIPVKLESDLDEREKGETIFYFPFNKPEMPKEKAYVDVLTKLKKLVSPTLFLSNLEQVKWIASNESGEYKKEYIEKKTKGDLRYEKIVLYQQIGKKHNYESLYLFSRNTDNCIYSIGYFLDDSNRIVKKDYTAFCFFPTKVTTDLNFVIHAPFLLTDSREGIKETEPHNTKMIELLACLSADSIEILKEINLVDDNMFNFVPYQKDKFFDEVWDNENDKDVLRPKLFAPFYEHIKRKLVTSEILPSFQGNYSKKSDGYWADSPEIAKLFSNVQLSQLVKNSNAKWVFTTIGRTKDVKLTEYIDGGSDRSWEKRSPNLIKASLDFENKIADLITSEFIAKQTNEWLHQFYEYLLARKSYIDKFKTKPIFKDATGQVVSAFKEEEKKLYNILFLPVDNEESSFKTVNAEFLNNTKTKEFFDYFGIKKPSLKDEIINHILPLYDGEDEIDTEQHFKKFFNYWKNEGKSEDFIDLIRDKSFILFKTTYDKKRNRSAAREVYYPTAELEKYFETKSDTRFVDLENYHSFITETRDKQLLKEFLIKLGVSEKPRVLKKEITDISVKSNLKLRQSTYGYDDRNTTIDKIIDGCQEIIQGINPERSLLLWKFLGKMQYKIKSQEYWSDVNAFYLDSELKGQHKYFYYSQQIQFFEATSLTLLKTRKWLYSKNNELVAPSEITIRDIASGYEYNSELEKLLGFEPIKVLSISERIAQKFNSEEEAEEAKKALEEKREKEKRRKERKSADSNSRFEIGHIDDAIESLGNLSRLSSKYNNENSGTFSNFDEDEEFAKGIEELKKQLEVKKSRADLAESINESLKYSFNWFKAYLKLLTTYGEKQDTQRQKSISFQEIKPYKDDNKYFLLCGANSYISAEIENAEDFKISLIFGNGKRENIIVEGVSKKGQDLLIYCREGIPTNTLSKLSSVFKIEINFTPVLDLLNRLYNAFTNNNYIVEWESINEVLPPLNFIYGPPGTGKTTTLCNRINKIITRNPNSKFLVLTPTNKASDVICKKLWEIDSDIFAIRLSSPTDEDLAEEGIYRDELNKDDMKDISVVASTIHRLPYFDIKDIGLLFQYKWDYVIFDESSMIGLHYISFAIMALFKSNPKTQFIVAGDPKQIPPVVEIDEKEIEDFDYQDENIYKMLNLESFEPSKQIIREIDSIINLETQYRSIPQIGQIFSDLSYSRLLKHDREENKKDTKPLPKEMRDIFTSNVSFIDIPLDQDNSIFKINKLIYSSYHTYCAILVSEIINYFDSVNKTEHWSIGLITPYKAQAILLNRMITSYGISERIKVISDTVHGFQGDECDVVFFVCNPNNYHYSGHLKALLSKEYIYNVAISRARDYLIVLHPFSAIRDNYFIKKIEHSFKSNFGNISVLNVSDIEKVLFNDSNYIEKNSYVSGHDNVNVFGLSDMKYFIKTSDTAIDIQLKDIRRKQDLINRQESNVYEVESPKIEGVKVVGKIDLSKFDKYHKK